MANQEFKRMKEQVLYLPSEKKTMAHAKMIWLWCDIIGIPGSVYAFILNLDNVKSSIIALLMIVYLMLRIYYYAVQKRQSVREKELDLRSKSVDVWHKEQGKMKHESKTK
jgi:hypothetical protein